MCYIVLFFKAHLKRKNFVMPDTVMLFRPISIALKNSIGSGGAEPTIMKYNGSSRLNWSLLAF